MGSVARAKRVVIEEGTPSVGLSAPSNQDAFGGVGSKILGQQIGIQEEAKRRADDLRSKKLAVDLSNLRNSTVLDYKKQKGLNASESFDEYRDKYYKQVEDLTKDLTEDQRFLAESIVARDNGLFDHALEGHMDAERISAENKGDQDLIATLINDSAMSYGAVGFVDQNLALIQASTDDMSHRNGWTQESKDLARMDVTGKLISAVVGSAVSEGDTYTARAYFDKYKDHLSPAMKEKIQKTVELSEFTGQAQIETDSIYGKDVSFSEKLSLARQLDDPKLRDEVVKRLKTRNQELKELKSRQESEAGQIALDHIHNGGSVESLSVDIRDRLKLSTINSLYTYQSKLNAGGSSTNPEVYYTLMQASVLERDKFLATNLVDFVDKLSPSDFKYLVKRQTNSRSDRVGDPVEGVFKAVESILDENGFSKKGKKERSVFYNQVRDAIGSFKDISGIEPSYSDIKDISMGLLKEYDRKFRVRDILPLVGDTEFSKTPVSDFRKEDVELATEQLVKNGLEVTEENIRFLIMRAEQIRGGH